MYDNVYYTCEYTHKAKEKINAMIAAPDDYQFYSIGARNPNFTASAPYDPRTAGANGAAGAYSSSHQYHQVHEAAPNPYHPQVTRQMPSDSYGRGFSGYRYEEQQQQQQQQSWSQASANPNPYDYHRYD